MDHPSQNKLPNFPRGKKSDPSACVIRVRPANIKNGVGWFQQVMTEIDNVGKEGGGATLTD